MWQIYDELISAVPPGLTVKECIIGIHWTLIVSAATGMAHTPFESGHGLRGGSAISGIGKTIAGMPVRSLAEYVKSWNPYEASLGLAAINSVFNSPDQIEKLTGKPIAEQPQVSAFVHFAEKVRNRKVAVVGHFPDLDELAKICEFTILERNPGEGDLPDPACEYVIPEQDYVFITATSILNKTLPRLLELSRNAFTFLVGPSTPMAPLLFNYGIEVLAGTTVVDQESVRRSVQEGAARTVFDYGARMVKVHKQEWEKR